MNAAQRFERDLPDQLLDLYLQPMPDYRDDLLGRIAATRQRPTWAFPGRWLPMSVVTSTVATSPPVRWPTVVVLGLLTLALAAGALLVAGSLQRRLPPPFGPAGNGSLVFGDGAHIVAVNPDGSDRRTLTAGPGLDLPPSRTTASVDPPGVVVRRCRSSPVAHLQPRHQVA